MDLGSLQANVAERFTSLKENKTAYYSLIVIIIILVIMFLRNTYKKIVAKEKAEPIFIRNVKSAMNKPIEVPDTEIQPPSNGVSFTYSVWMYIDDFNKKKNEVKHVFHKGDLQMNTMAPGVFILPNLNSLAIVMDTVNRVKSSVVTKKSNGKTPDNFKDDVAGLYEMDSACACEEIFKVEKDYKMASYVRDSMGNGKCYLFNKEKPLVDNKDGVSWTKTGGNSFTMSPYENPSILQDDNSTVIVENVPLQRWFHLVIVVNNLSVEVYVDGKLYKTLILQSNIKRSGGSLYSGLSGGYDGMINELRYFPYPLRYIDVYNMYARGPTPFYFMYMFRGKSELYEKHLAGLKKSLDQVMEDTSDIFTGLSEDIFGAADLNKARATGDALWASSRG